MELRWGIFLWKQVGEYFCCPWIFEAEGSLYIYRLRIKTLNTFMHKMCIKHLTLAGVLEKVLLFFFQLDVLQIIVKMVERVLFPESETFASKMASVICNREGNAKGRKL